MIYILLKNQLLSLTNYLIKLKTRNKKIEKEMELINISHKKIIDEITTSFKENSFLLNKKEKQLKFELVKKVMEVIEELKSILFQSNKIIFSF